METKAHTKLPFREELIALIKKKLPLHSVNVISSHMEKRKLDVYLASQFSNPQKLVTFTLLIIGHKTHSKGLGDLMDDLNGKMQQRCRVYVIFYTLSNVKKRLDYGDNFLSRVIFKTPCLYKEDDTLSKFSNYALFCHQSVYKHIQGTWKSRMGRAEYLLSIIDNIEPKEDPLAMLSTMHYALEQICLGLLYLFWEFKPQHYSLSYLLHLCSHFTQLPQTIFPKETYGLHRIYYILCNAHHLMRFKSKNEFTYSDTDKAYNRCLRFIEEAMTLGEKQLEHLKELHCRPLINNTLKP